MTSYPGAKVRAIKRDRAVIVRDNAQFTHIFTREHA